MARREESDSGLRKGFIREDEAIQLAKAISRESSEEPVVETPSVVKDSEQTNKTSTQDKKDGNPTGPTISMQGVSGKKITSVVKVVKRRAKPKKNTETVAEENKVATTTPNQGKAKATDMIVGTQEAVKTSVSATLEQATDTKVITQPKGNSDSTVHRRKTADVSDSVKSDRDKQSISDSKNSSAGENVSVSATQTSDSIDGGAVTRKVELDSQRELKADKSATATKKPIVNDKSKPSAKSEDAHIAQEDLPKQSQVRTTTTQSTLASTQSQKTAGGTQDVSITSGAPVKPTLKSEQQTTAQATSFETVQAKSAGTNVKKATAVPSDAKEKPRVKTDQSGLSRVNRAELGSKQKPLVDRGITTSRYSNLPRIRPQQGNYIGKNPSTPKVDLQSSNSGRRDGQRRTFGNDRNNSVNKDKPFSRQGGYGRKPERGGFVDKDAPETNNNHQRKSTRTGSRSAAGGFKDLGEARKAENRKFNNQRRDRNRHDHIQSSRFSADDALDNGRFRRTKKRDKADAKPQQRAVLTNVKLPEVLTVKELAEALKKTSAEVITKLMGYGVMATLNQELNYDTAEVIANEFGIKAEQLVEIKAEDILFDESVDKEEDLVERPPVVVVMGHVDHGKTSILDYIRKASVAKGEAGGITQHIGAYTVKVHDKKITFLDTPGHEAFTVMRARGAQVTDIAILVVAADDGVMPQTIEAINHARAANTEIIVAINKIDRANANLDKVRQELATHNLMSSEWGGDTTIVPVSAKTGENMDELLEMVLLTAEVLELRANPNRQAKGTVIEARLDRGRGTVATMLVQRGTLKVGDTVVVGSMIGHVRAMSDDKGRDITSAGPSQPVEILGLPEVPEGGDLFYSVQNEKIARQLVEERQIAERESKLHQKNHVSLDNLFEQMSKGEVKDLNIIVKADVQGSVEAVKQSLEKLSNDEVNVQVIHGAVGAVTESDVRLAEVANAVIIGFNVRPAANVSDLANESNVDIRLYRVIYDAIEDTEKALKGMLEPTFKEVVLGHATVRETFNVSGIGTIAGCYVTDGKITRTSDVRIVRDGIVIQEGKIGSLKRFKDDVKEVAAGYECGMSIEKYNDIKIGDQFETFEMQAVKVE